MDIEQNNSLLTSELPAYRIRNSADVMAHFQAQLNKFPRIQVNGEERINFSEFGAYIFRPVGEPSNQLTHLLFPETIISIPNSTNSLKYHTSTAFPQVILMADSNTNELYVKVTAYRLNDEGRIESSSLLLSMEEVFLNSDIWNAISPEDKLTLRENGFGPGMTHEQWSKAINAYQAHVRPIAYPRDIGLGSVNLRELPLLIARRGSLGINNIYHMLPEFTFYALQNNRFFYEDELPQELGDAHIHSLVEEMSDFQKRIADMVGEDVMRRNPSVPDIHYKRANNSIFSKVNRAYGTNDIDTVATFAGVLTVDALGVVTGARYFDYYQVDLKKVAELNDRAWDTMLKSGNPDPKIIAEHYRYIDSVTTQDFGTEDASPHVGDPNYDRSQDPDVGFLY